MARIVLCGPSGIGKTTVAKELAHIYRFPFVSGSYSDLIPITRDLHQSDMISKDPREIFSQDMRLLGLRKKSYEKNPKMFSDRSPVDSIVQGIYKLSPYLPSCDIDLLVKNGMEVIEKYISAIIFLRYPSDLSKWNLEDNGKRVSNPYFQRMISTLYEDFLVHTLVPKLSTPVLVVNSLDRSERIDRLREFIDNFIITPHENS